MQILILGDISPSVAKMLSKPHAVLTFQNYILLKLIVHLTGFRITGMSLYIF